MGRGCVQACRVCGAPDNLEIIVQDGSAKVICGSCCKRALADLLAERSPAWRALFWAWVVEQDPFAAPPPLSEKAPEWVQGVLI